MNLGYNEGFPSNIKKTPENEKISDNEEPFELEKTKLLPDEKQEIDNQSGSAIEKFQITSENPIEKIDIGLKHTLGHFLFPTRIVVTLKDGRIGDMSWEEAEPHLPPEFRIVRELGEQARLIEKKAFDLENSIRGGTDVMKRSGHIKDASFRLLMKKRPALQYLNDVVKLSKEIDEIAQQSFLQLRQMADDGGAQESHAETIQELFSCLKLCQSKLDDLCEKAFQQFPKVKDMYENVFRGLEEEKSLKGGIDLELPESK